MQFGNFKQFIDRAQRAQKTVDDVSQLHHVDIQLTKNEYNAMTLLCATATATAYRDGDKPLAEMFVRLTNRLHENDPNFVPYDAQSIAKIAVTKSRKP